MVITKKIILSKYPDAIPRKSHIKILEEKISLNKENDVLIRVIYFSVDPYMRNRMRPSNQPYIDSFQLNQAIVSMGIGEVVASNSPQFSRGDICLGMLPWQHYCTADSSTIEKIDNTKYQFKLSTYLGVLGMPGLTAYVGVNKIAKPKLNDVFFISAAAGSVGSLAGQLAKQAGCYVVGLTSTSEKMDYLINDLNFDKAISYKQASAQLNKEIKQVCPNGIDINFENAGGLIFETVINHMKPRSLIVLCGLISQYNSKNPRKGPSNFNTLLSNKIKIQDFIVTNHQSDMIKFREEISPLLQNGSIKHHETIVEGLENAWDAFTGLFYSRNMGKMLVRVSGEPMYLS